jgi:hypothetical protein
MSYDWEREQKEVVVVCFKGVYACISLQNMTKGRNSFSHCMSPARDCIMWNPWNTKPEY